MLKLVMKQQVEWFDGNNTSQQTAISCKYNMEW